jgi:hypothetical protein
MMQCHLDGSGITRHKEFRMQTLTQALNQEIAGDEATLHLSNGDSFRIKGDVESVSDLFINVSLSNNPDKKGKKMVNVNHIVSIDWYTK